METLTIEIALTPRTTIVAVAWALALMVSVAVVAFELPEIIKAWRGR